ncbi:ATP dependent RNA helicase [Trichodelitschia bisporula]|uniref:RNA helicase n=1 Tax=Trichodelitschia bisporula TaxID=703511 RepID=A0A6G1HIE7_9PEZI|nr:ATP dependent RNA helicase [Trichodelitschia bisporula]
MDVTASGLYRPPSLLPIARHRESLLYLVETFPVTIIVGQTGSGKTTQIPQYLDQAGWCADGKAIAITQPRRVAATTVAARVAEEMRCQLGQDVGYSIRFEDATSSATRIKFMTDGLLLREALVDPLLSRYSVIMVRRSSFKTSLLMKQVDEAHERSLSSDVLLGLLKKIQKKRPDLRIIVSSATIQAEDFLRFFAADENGEISDSIGCILSIDGRMYPVDIHYLKEPAEDYVERAVKTVLDIHTKEPDGDILVFLTGREEIERTVALITERAAALPPQPTSLQPLPLYAGLPTDQQMYVFEPAADGVRKVVVATNIAEASVTIDGIAYVIDCGFVKLRAYNPVTGIETLTATPVSQASATQRAGRAGRTKPGKCYRLYTEAAFASFAASTVPEIQRANLAPTILQLKALGIDNVARFAYLTPPPAELVTRALELLYALGALDDYAKLTRPQGLRMAELAVEPMMAKVLLCAASFGCVSEALSIAAMTSLGGAVWFEHEGMKKAGEGARRKFAAEEGDHLTLLNVYLAFVGRGKKEAKWCKDHYLNYKSMVRAVSIRNQLKRYLERFSINVEESLAEKQGGPERSEALRRCLVAGFFAHAARMQPDGSFKAVNGTVLHAHPSSLMFNRKADWVVFHEITETGNKTFIRDITKVEKKWLLEAAPQYYNTK